MEGRQIGRPLLIIESSNIILPRRIPPGRSSFSPTVTSAFVGDFSSAGAADLEYLEKLPAPMFLLERGSLGYARGVFASSPSLWPGHLLYALELYQNDGPWTEPDDAVNFFLKGGPVMWLLLASLIAALFVVLERGLWWWHFKLKRELQHSRAHLGVGAILELAPLAKGTSTPRPDAPIDTKSRRNGS